MTKEPVMNNKMKQLTLNATSILLVPVPEGAKGISLGFDDPTRLYYYPANYHNSFDHRHIELPPGDWQLIGKDPLELTEKEASKIVEKVDGRRLFKCWVDYEYRESGFWTALESFLSLLKANNINKGIVLIKKIKS